MKLKNFIIVLLSAFLLNACSTSSASNSSSVTTDYATASKSGKYGTGPGNRQPYPQHTPANIEGVKGAKITNEPYSTRGNKDYTVLGKNYVVWRDVSGYYEEGTASWYGPGFHGQKTSNGERFNMNGYTAAHKNLPLPSFVKVTNLDNGKSLVVRVNDRGPFHSNRIIDLSKGAASYLGVIGPGTARVRLELVQVTQSSKTSHEEMNGFKPYIQVFTSSDRNRAYQIKNKIHTRTNQQTFVEQASGNYRVKVGPLTTDNADRVMNTIHSLGYKHAFFISN